MQHLTLADQRQLRLPSFRRPEPGLSTQQMNEPGSGVGVQSGLAGNALIAVPSGGSVGGQQGAPRSVLPNLMAHKCSFGDYPHYSQLRVAR